MFFLAPATAIDFWPWELTPLTSRVIGSFTAQVGVGALLLSLDRRWSAWKLIVQTFFVATALLLVGAIRAWDDFDTGNVVTYLYLGGLVAGDVALRPALPEHGQQAATRASERKRRGWDSNPRGSFTRPHDFQSCTLSRSVTSPERH